MELPDRRLRVSYSVECDLMRVAKLERRLRQNRAATDSTAKLLRMLEVLDVRDCDTDRPGLRTQVDSEDRQAIQHGLTTGFGKRQVGL